MKRSRTRLYRGGIEAGGTRERTDLSPSEAAALWKIGNLFLGRDIPRLALRWLEKGKDSDTISWLALEDDSTLKDHGAAFERALCELGEETPARPDAFRTALAVYLRDIVSGKVSPIFGAQQIKDDLLDAVKSEDGMILRNPLRAPEDTKKYAGGNLGVEYIYGAYDTWCDSMAGEDITAKLSPEKEEHVHEIEEAILKQARALLEMLDRSETQ